MPYLLSQYSDTQMGMYNQPRMRLLWLIFQRKISKTKDNNHRKRFQSAYWILSCTLLNFEKTALLSGPRSGYTCPWYMKATYSTVPWANYVNNGCWQLLWLIFHSGDLGPIAPHAGIHRAGFNLMERNIRFTYSAAEIFQLHYLFRLSLHPRYNSFLFKRFHTARKILQLWDKYIRQRYTALYHLFPHHFQRKGTCSPMAQIALSIKLSPKELQWTCLSACICRPQYTTLKKMCFHLRPWVMLLFIPYILT